MNSKQNIAAIVGMITVALILLFPSYEGKDNLTNKITVPLGYHFVFSPPSQELIVDLLYKDITLSRKTDKATSFIEALEIIKA